MNLRAKWILVETGIAAVIVGVLLWFMIPKFLAAQTINTPANFPDPNFRRAVEEFMRVPSRGIFTAAEAAAKTSNLDCGRRNIRDLTGVEYFIGIRSLLCQDNQLTSLDLSNNNALTHLICGYNQLTSLNLSKNTALTHLYCSQNQLASLDISNNIALTVLACAANQLTRLDVANNTALTELYCLRNQITSLDLSNNTALTVLLCEDNLLTSLDVSNCIALTKVDCRGNHLATLDLSSNISLDWIDLSSNELTSIPNLTNHKNLNALDVRNNNLDYDDWNDIKILRKVVGDPALDRFGMIQSGFAYSPQKGLDSFERPE